MPPGLNSPAQEQPREDAKPSVADVVAPENVPPLTMEEIDIARHREITSKAVSAILLLVLKWFKASRMSIMAPAELISRYFEIPLLRAITLRFKLPPTSPQDVWFIRCLYFRTGKE